MAPRLRRRLPSRLAGQRPRWDLRRRRSWEVATGHRMSRPGLPSARAPA